LIHRAIDTLREKLIEESIQGAPDTLRRAEDGVGALAASFFHCSSSR